MLTSRATPRSVMAGEALTRSSLGLAFHVVVSAPRNGLPSAPRLSLTRTRRWRARFDRHHQDVTGSSRIRTQFNQRRNASRRIAFRKPYRFAKPCSSPPALRRVPEIAAPDSPGFCRRSRQRGQWLCSEASRRFRNLPKESRTGVIGTSRSTCAAHIQLSKTGTRVP